MLARVIVWLKMKGIDATEDQTPKGESNAGGLQESAVQQFKSRCRILWLQGLDLHKIKDEVPADEEGRG